ncbi:hypothetical protein B0T22DRAFT_407582 [Podospora appendiculata]|uniref:VOC domain-containing protein n=1 Tax=Podospora appendiculata TaxID=314037 RepID=A0AAE0XAR1_9PEZI|nr:hypothetical protein B0T22DRAFT_407582 [Podospora appendiculata]
MSQFRIPLPIINTPDKVQLARLSYVHFSHPNLDEFHQFALDFGFVEAARENDTIYYRGYGKDVCCYIASKSSDAEKHFNEAGYIARTEQDFLKASQLKGSSPITPNPAAIGGGSFVSLVSPSKLKVHILWGVEERPEPNEVVTATELHKGGYNTALEKTRKGEFQRFKVGPAMVHKLGHYGCLTSKWDEDVAFYTQNFNFIPSDVLWEERDGEEVDALTFMHLDQGKEYSDHHTLFLSRAPAGFPDEHRIHHSSFEVEDFDTQLLGHEYLLGKSYKPIWGVGRHIFGSQIFDYWKDTSGFAIEHYADSDVVNEDNLTGREKSDGPASMYIWGPVRPEAELASHLADRQARVASRVPANCGESARWIRDDQPTPLCLEPETTVVVVGAGPSGLALGALLGRMNIKVILLEKDTEVCEDPRGIVVNGDAVRISYQIGIGEGLTKRIGKDIGVLNFHRGNFRQSPFMSYDIREDWLKQSVSNNITQFQPNYEREIRAILGDFPSCQLRTGCEVLSREVDGDHTIIEYLDQSGARHSIRSAWLVGADGKKGVVRKKFLEPEGIKQEESEWSYVGTWVAANLKITDPTPESHPEFPLWKLGYTPEQVHEAFWPTGFHFCNDSKRPQVSGRFGPPNSGFWRHEYSVEPEDNLDDVEQHFWELFASWMIIPGSKFARALRKTTVEFPRDCIEVVRCRPFTFATKVVNKWYARNTLLIGDAAHVFPPFGGQGIATGIRDAQALGWRLAIMSRMGSSLSPARRERILTGWSQERRHGWSVSMKATKLNGSIVNQRSWLGGLVFRAWHRLLWLFPGLARYKTNVAFKDKLVFTHKTCPDGFFVEKLGGGVKIAQVWTRRQGQGPLLSDGAFFRNLAHLSLLVLVRRPADHDSGEVARILKVADLPGEMLTMEDVTFYNIHRSYAEGAADVSAEGREAYYPCTAKELVGEGITPINRYDATAVQDRFPASVKYVLLRPDFLVHSVAKDGDELLRNLGLAGEYFS